MRIRFAFLYILQFGALLAMLAFMMSIPAWFLFPKIMPSPLLFFTAVAIPLAIYAIIYYGTMNVQDKQEFALGQWAFWKKFISVDQNFELVNGEKILFQLTPCFVRSFAWFLTTASVSEGPKDIIVTNKRILVAFLVFGIREIFGEFNLWHPKIGKVPETPSKTYGLRKFMKGDIPIRKISLGKDNELKVEVEGSGFRANYSIYHPKAQEIYEIFSKPV